MRGIRKFEPEVCDQLGYYVYALAKPVDNDHPKGEIFYIGKGRNNRVFNHLYAADKLKGEDKVSLKIQTIQDVGPENVKVYILRHNIKVNDNPDKNRDEEVAFDIESVLIDLLNYGFAFPKELTNDQAGHHGGILTEEEAHSKAADDLVLTPEERRNTIIVKIGKSYQSGKNLYDAIRGIWKMDDKRPVNGQVVLGIINGVVRGAYVADEWIKLEGGDTFIDEEIEGDAIGSWCFKGHPVANPEKYLCKSVRNLISNPNAQANVRYIHD